ncbi:MAG: PKD domain-containing protein [Candidatus Methylomirabilales bacterium]
MAAIDKEVVLQTGTNTLQVRLTSKPGSLLTVTITGTVTVTITDPPDGSTVTTNSVLVRGTVEADGEEVGVTVNGFAAAVQGNTFAFLLPVTPGAITITAVATTAAGATASESVEITVATPPTPTLTLHASPASGVAPLTVVFALLGAPVPTAIDLDLDGDGAVDFSGPTLEGQTFIYPQPGLFFPTVTVTDSQGNQFTGSTLVQVDDEAAIDALLQAKWTGMKDALGAGDIPLALTHIAFRSRPRYDEAFRAIEARLPDIDTILTNVTLVEVRNGVATYEATRTDVGVEKLFDIRFVIDEDGIWRIEAF